jgi:beta-lactamase class A
LVEAANASVRNQAPLRCEAMGSAGLPLSDFELARVSVALVDVDGVTRLEHRPNVTHYAASIMKLAVAVATLRELDRGRLSPNDVLSYDGGFASGFDGSRFTIDADSVDVELLAAGPFKGDSCREALEVFPAHWVRRQSFGVFGSTGEPGSIGEGVGVSVARALVRSITVSSNEGANLLMQTVGLEAINLALLEGGCDHSVVERMVFDTAARDAGRTNTLTALDSAQLLWSIRFGTIAADDSLTYLCEVLRTQTQRSMTAFALREAIGRGEVVVGNKEGQTNEVLHDVAFVEPADTDPFVLAVCTSGMTEDEATNAVRRIATYAYENRFAWKSSADNFR